MLSDRPVNARQPQTQSFTSDNGFAQSQVAEDPAPLLEVSGLRVSYGNIDALVDIALRVREGEIVTVIGPNGAGKSTLLSALMGILPSQGEIALRAATTISDRNVATRVRSGLALVPETRALFSSMSVKDNLVLGAFRFRRESRGHLEDALEGVYQLFPRLKERSTQEAATLSGGERQMLALGRALMGRPRLLMLDEPSLGLAPLVVRDIFRIISDLRDRGISVLLVEQNARAALRVADYAYVLELGRIAMEGSANTLADDPRVIEAYLGLRGKHQDLLNT
jgi:branched-chain amino acid transport system ATP-binding protein